MDDFSAKLGAMDSVVGVLGRLSRTLRMHSCEIENMGQAVNHKTQLACGLNRSLSAARANVFAAAEKMQQLSSTLEKTAASYRKTENEILKAQGSDTEDERHFFLDTDWSERIARWIINNNPSPFPRMFGITDLIIAITCGGKTEESLSFLNLKTKKELSAKYEPGNVYLEGEIGVEGSLAKYKKKRSRGLFSSEAELSALTGAVSAKGTVSLFKDGKFEPSIGVGAGAEAKGINAKVSGQVGNDDFDVHGDVEGTVGYAKAEAGLDFDIRKGKFGGKAEVGAAVFKGKATGGFKVFGHKVDFSIEGEALSVGAKAEFGVDEDSVCIGGKLSALLGLGFKIKISK